MDRDTVVRGTPELLQQGKIKKVGERKREKDNREPER